MNIEVEKSSDVGLYVYCPHGEACLRPTLTEDGYDIVWFNIRKGERNQGLGKKFLSVIKKEFDSPLRPIDVLPSAKGFWDKMQACGLVTI